MWKNGNEFKRQIDDVMMRWQMHVNQKERKNARRSFDSISSKSISCIKSCFNFPSNYSHNLNSSSATQPTMLHMYALHMHHTHKQFINWMTKCWCSISNTGRNHITSNGRKLGQLMYSNSIAITSASKPLFFHHLLRLLSGSRLFFHHMHGINVLISLYVDFSKYFHQIFIFFVFFNP